MRTTIAEGSGDEASIELLLRHARSFKLDEGEAIALVGEMARQIGLTWREHAKSCGMSARKIGLYEPAFEHEEAALARDLTSGGRGHGGPPGVAPKTETAPLRPKAPKPKERRDDGQGR